MVIISDGYFACGPQAGRLAAAKIACGSNGAAKIACGSRGNIQMVSWRPVSGAQCSAAQPTPRTRERRENAGQGLLALGSYAPLTGNIHEVCLLLLIVTFKVFFKFYILGDKLS